LDELDQVSLKIFTVPVDEIAQSLEHILLMLGTVVENRGMLLDQDQEFVSEAHTDLQKSFGCHQLEVEFRVSRPDHVEILGSDPCDELLTVKWRLVEIEDVEEQADDIFHDSLPLEVSIRSLEPSLQQVQQYGEQVDVVPVVLEVSDHFADQDDHQLGDTVLNLLIQMHRLVILTVEGVHGEVDEATDLKLAKVVTERSLGLMSRTL